MPRAKIHAAEDISPAAKLFSLEIISGDFSFVPGQYTAFEIATSDGRRAIRTYSICSLPEGLPRFQLCVRQASGGLGAGFLNEHVAKEIELTPPAGDFIISPKADKPGSILFIASGVGIAPVRPMLKDYLAKNPEAEVKLVYILKDGEYLFREEWEDMEKKYKDFKIETVATSPALRAPSPRQGRETFVVGSPAFVSQTMAGLLNLGYNRQRIKTDMWE